LQLEAYCQAPGCNSFVVFDLDVLIEAEGTDLVLPEDGPGIECPQCGGSDMKFKLVFLHPETDEPSA